MSAGPIKRLNIFGRNFAVAADSDPPRDKGGKENSTDMNGDGTSRTLSEMKPGKIGPAAIVIDDSNGDHEYIQEKKDLGGKGDCECEYVDGQIWYGRLAIVGSTEYSPKKGTMEVTLEGDTLTQQ